MENYCVSNKINYVNKENYHVNNENYLVNNDNDFVNYTDDFVNYSDIDENTVGVDHPLKNQHDFAAGAGLEHGGVGAGGIGEGELLIDHRTQSAIGETGFECGMDAQEFVGRGVK